MGLILIVWGFCCNEVSCYEGLWLLLLIDYVKDVLNANNFCLFYYYIGYSQKGVMPVFYRECIVPPYLQTHSC